MRDDEAQATIDAIRQIKHILDVQPNIASPDEVIAEMRVKHKLTEKKWKVLSEDV